MSEYADRRVSYAGGAVDLAATPLRQFEAWYGEAVAAGLPEPNAMVLATVSGSGEPSARTVLLKQADRRGFVFYTNYDSRKGRSIAEGGGRVAVLFPWHPVQRQVGVLGVAERVPVAESLAYFGSRPWASRIGAWASDQSRVVADREALDRRFEEVAARWPDRGRPDDVPMPDHWGGYLVRPTEVEFWQGRPGRLHDRLVFVAVGPAAAEDMDDAATWRLERRQP